MDSNVVDPILDLAGQLPTPAPALPTTSGISTPEDLKSLSWRTVIHKQGSSDWLKWRSTGIGASESAQILGRSPYGSADELYRLKRGELPPKPVNVKMPELVKSATIVEGEWDDYIKVEIGGVTVFKSNQWDTGPCELSKSWYLKEVGGDYGPVDVTASFKTKGLIDTKTSVKVGGLGEGYTKVRLVYLKHLPRPGAADCYQP